MLSDDVKKTFSLFRKLLIFAKLFVEAVVIFVAIFLKFKSLYPNIDTNQKKFKNMATFFIISVTIPLYNRNWNFSGLYSIPRNCRELYDDETVSSFTIFLNRSSLSFIVLRKALYSISFFFSLSLSIISATTSPTLVREQSSRLSI